MQLSGKLLVRVNGQQLNLGQRIAMHVHLQANLHTLMNVHPVPLLHSGLPI